jgi:glycosyltransferase involved in cell wall biosynthesis
LIYDKVRWKHEEFERSLINPICQTLEKHHLSYKFIRYGAYTPEELQDKISRAKAVIFLCEHETQGLAYQQILSTGTPILAWERAGYWEDPYYFPNKVKFAPVSSTPYWDERCGIKFAGIADFEQQLLEFNSKFASFKPRDYITGNLSLEKCAAKYLDIYRLVLNELN